MRLWVKGVRAVRCVVMLSKCNYIVAPCGGDLPWAPVSRPEPPPSFAVAGRALAALADAQTASPVFDPLAFEEAAALIAPLVPPDGPATDALARLLGLPARLADDWLRETQALLTAGDQADPAVRDKGSRRIAVLALAWTSPA